MNAQGVQHLTCVRGIWSDHPAATRQLKQGSLVILYEGLTSGREQMKTVTEAESKLK